MLENHDIARASLFLAIFKQEFVPCCSTSDDTFKAEVALKRQNRMYEAGKTKVRRWDTPLMYSTLFPCGLLCWNCSLWPANSQIYSKCAGYCEDLIIYPLLLLAIITLVAGMSFYVGPSLTSTSSLALLSLRLAWSFWIRMNTFACHKIFNWWHGWLGLDEIIEIINAMQ